MEPVTCPFCSPDNRDIITKNTLWYARWDKYPVTKGHLLVIPFRHVQDCFDLTKDERMVLWEMLESCKQILDRKFAPDGYNIGVNIGCPAGQSVMHCHIHVIPRYKGDTEHPRGGVRGVIPDKRRY
jgi:diadenosine tetraphosphate (Ap4A) HIT family hydrolase